MRTVTRGEYVDFVSGLPEDWARPVEGHSLSVMQYVDPSTNDLVAQAVYIIPTRGMSKARGGRQWACLYQIAGS